MPGRSAIITKEKYHELVTARSRLIYPIIRMGRTPQRLHSENRRRAEPGADPDYHIRGIAVSSYLFERKHRSVRFLQNSIEGSDIELLDALRVLGMENAVSGYLADEILRWAAFLIALLLAGVLIRGIVFSLGIVSHLPILHGLNKTAGLLLGFAEGVVLVWIFFVVITVCASTSVGGQLLKMTAQSSILSWLYRNNLLLNWLSL